MSDNFTNEDEDMEIINIDTEEADDDIDIDEKIEIEEDKETEVFDEDEEVEEVDYNTVYEQLEEQVERKVPPKNRNKILIIIAAVAIICIAVGVIYERLSPCSDYLNIEDYYASKSGTTLILNGNLIEDSGCIVNDGEYYLSQNFVNENLTDKFFYDENGLLIYTTATKIYDIPVDSMGYTIDGEAVETEYKCAITVNDTVYIAVDFLKDKTGCTYVELENPSRLVLVQDGMECEVVELDKDFVIRETAAIKAKIIEDTSTISDDNINEWYLVGIEDDWTQLQSTDGRTGYIKSKQISTVNEAKVYMTGYYPEEYTTQQKDYEIMLVWNAIYSQGDNDKIEGLLENTEGITTVSPTWYQVTDADGNMNSFADWDYISYVHDMGMEIWPLISDFTSDDEGAGWDEKELLTNTESRRNFIDNIMYEITTYNYDGINIDFETVPKDAGDAYIQFIRELSIECRKECVVLSVDNYVPKSFNLYYNRAAQGECVDYVIVMGYDEHYSGGDTAGSVASAAFVQEGIAETLKEVPADKVINAVPFYTRLWKEGIEDDGSAYIQATSYSMQGGVDIANELGLEIKWDDTVKQNVAAGYVDGTYYSIWLEDEESMAARMEIVNSYDIAGIAAWQLGMEMDSVWDILLQ